MRELGLTLLATLSAVVYAGPAGAQPRVLPPLGTGAALEIPDLTVETGTVVDIPIRLATSDPFDIAMAILSTEPSELQILDLVFGAGLEQFVADGGSLPTCDIIVETTGGAAFFFMFMTPAYDPAIYGDEYMLLRCSVGAPAGATTEILYTDVADQIATITVIEPGGQFQRGDVNGDTQCDIVDAVSILEILFVPGVDSDCQDAADIDDNGHLQVTDAVLLLAALFSSGEPMDETCGTDPSPDSLPDCTSTCTP